MTVFVYRAVDQVGKINSGRMPAINERELEARLRNAGLDVIHSKPMTRSTFSILGAVPRKELINFCFHMDQTLRGGVLLTETLVDLVEGVSHRHFRDVLTVVLEAVRGGQPLSAAMRDFPDVFDEVFVGLIEAGEEAGTLPESFGKLMVSLRWLDELTAQVKKMLLYPAFTVVVLLAVTVFMLLFLVPQLAAFIKAASGELPVQTRLLLALSDLMVAHWGKVLCLPFVLAAIVFAIVRVGGDPVRESIDRGKLKIPVIGGVLQKVVLARFSSLFAMLYAAGVPILDSLQVCQNAAGNRHVARAIAKVRDEIVSGCGISEAFARAKVFPNLVIRMVRVGEATGELDRSMENVSYFFNREIQETIGRIQAMIEPVLTMLLGLLLGWLMMSVLGPIYDLLGKLKV